MKKFNKILKITGLILLMLLASFGVGVPILFNSREKYMDNEVKIEQVEKKNDEEDEAETLQEIKG